MPSINSNPIRSPSSTPSSASPNFSALVKQYESEGLKPEDASMMALQQLQRTNPSGNQSKVSAQYQSLMKNYTSDGLKPADAQNMALQDLDKSLISQYTKDGLKPEV